MNRAQIDPATAVQFLETAFDADDWLAVFLKSNETSRVAERIAPVSLIVRPQFQSWLCRENRASANVYVSVNVLRARTASRRRPSVRAVRHVFLDVDEYLDPLIEAIAMNSDLPAPSYVLRTSDDRGHLLWRVSGFTVDDAESLQRGLAHELQTDSAATACSQLTRLPGYLNHKRRPECRVAIEYQTPLDVFYTPLDFPRPLQGVRPDRRTNTKSCLIAGADVIHRARRYLAAVPPAVSGQHGDVRTFGVCCRLARGFGLTDAEALSLLGEWNAACQPPWTERELIDKLRHARRYGRESIGGLLGSR